MSIQGCGRALQTLQRMLASQNTGTASVGTQRISRMTDFPYRPAAGIRPGWRLECLSLLTDAVVEDLCEVEKAVAQSVSAYCHDNALAITRVRGGHGWREFTISSGNVISYRWTMVLRDFRCAACGYDTWDETYRVHDRVWAAAGNGGGRLCISCLERRLNRPLVPGDFVSDDDIQADRQASPRLTDRQKRPHAPRPNIRFDAPIGSVDLCAFDDAGIAYEILACPDCLPWRAEVVRDPQTNEILIREWHAVDCELFQELIRDDHLR